VIIRELRRGPDAVVLREEVHGELSETPAEPSDI
jgi:hypothetical protein